MIAGIDRVTRVRTVWEEGRPKGVGSSSATCGAGATTPAPGAAPALSVIVAIRPVPSREQGCGCGMHGRGPGRPRRRPTEWTATSGVPGPCLSLRGLRRRHSPRLQAVELGPADAPRVEERLRLGD